jgi:hypothetical protein
VKQKPLGGFRRKWKDNIKMDITELSCNDVKLEWVGTGLNGEIS